ncbi:histidine phosphatase family protein [Ferrimonas sp. SCSIO 43195]|uniref:histidine phosphatase family protein n=1 Tax=Ferrimonas sp. SCSIO 43195 TaxID=2822844 RepID=UPI002074CC03|nr:histidine phosphatase family protein [Ferrimonas sp. SCSIO 43195]USD36004.1 histidine phosphatase family protein [Ferrimonas sp. SCSIO 43195]
MTQFFLIRHGETQWNRQGRLQGSQDSPLTETGLAQAHSLAQDLRQQRLDALYASPLLRARRTAEIINQYQRLPLLTHPGLSERNFGDLEGRRRDERPELWQAMTLRFQQNSVDVPGFEPADSLSRRAMTTLASLHQCHPDASVAVVTHGEWLRVVGNALAGHAPWSDATELQGNASVVMLNWPVQ